MADQSTDGANRGERNSLDLDALAVSDRFRLFNFTRRDDHVAYLWVLRALDRLRAVHQVQAHSDEVAAALAELAAVHDEAPRLDGGLREKLDAMAEDGMVHRLEDASRAGSLARYRNRQSVYQFSELGYRAFAAVEDVLAARISDANLSRLVFSDILDDLKSLAAAVPEVEGASDAGDQQGQGGSGAEAMLRRAAEADERPFLGYDELLEDWRRRWTALRAWFAPDGFGESRASGLRSATRAAVSGVIALLRQVTEAQRGGVNRSSQLRHLAEWVFNAPDEGAAYALMSAAFNLRSARHLGGAHDDAEQFSERAAWWDAPGVEISATLFRRGKAPTPGVPQPVRAHSAIRAELRRRQAAERAAERAAAGRLLESGVHGRVLDEAETRVLLRLLTLATEARTVVAGRVAAGAGGNDVLTMRLVPSELGSAVRTTNGVLHLPGLRLDLAPAGPADGGR